MFHRQGLAFLGAPGLRHLPELIPELLVDVRGDHEAGAQAAGREGGEPPPPQSARELGMGRGSMVSIDVHVWFVILILIFIILYYILYGLIILYLYYIELCLIIVV